MTRRQDGKRLSEEKRQQVVALGKLGWPLRRIEERLGVRRETASAYLKAAGVPVRPERTRRAPKPASQVSTDSAGSKPASGAEMSTDSGALTAHPAAAPGSSEGPAPPPPPGRAPTASACEPYRELIEEALGRHRNAMAIYQNLVSFHGFTDHADHQPTESTSRNIPRSGPERAYRARPSRSDPH